MGRIAIGEQPAGRSCVFRAGIRWATTASCSSSFISAYIYETQEPAVNHLFDY